MTDQILKDILMARDPLMAQLFAPVVEGKSLAAALMHAYECGRAAGKLEQVMAFEEPITTIKREAFNGGYSLGRRRGYQECWDMVRHRLGPAITAQASQLMDRIWEREAAERKTHRIMPLPEKVTS